MNNTVLIIFAVLLVLAAVARIAKYDATRIKKDSEKTSASEKKITGVFSVLYNFHGWYGIIAFIMPALKIIYKNWKKAPHGSDAKLGWGLLLSLIGAAGIWLLIKLIDIVVNRQPQKPKMFAEEPSREKMDSGESEYIVIQT